MHVNERQLMEIEAVCKICF